MKKQKERIFLGLSFSFMFMGNHIVPKKEGGEERENYRVMCALLLF